MNLSPVYPIDLLADGKIVDGIWACYACRRSDIQKGDTVSLEVVNDFGDDRDHCVRVFIGRRPGAKLPECQKPKEDTRYARDSMFNDIDNGEDVSDDAILKLFPATPFNPRAREAADPNGLPEVYEK